jgi:hypothetical protein
MVIKEKLMGTKCVSCYNSPMAFHPQTGKTNIASMLDIVVLRCANLSAKEG